MNGPTRLLVFVLLAWLSTSAGPAERAPADGVAVLLSENSAEYRQIAETIAAGLAKSNGAAPSLRIIDVDQPGTDQLATLLRPPPRLLVTVGTRATRLALYQKVEMPTLAVFIPRLSFDALIAPLDREALAKSVSALYLDPAPAQQLALAQAILPPAATVGVLASARARPMLEEIEIGAKSAGLKLRIASPAEKHRSLETLNEELPGIDLLLTIFDPGLMDRRVVTQLLYAAYGKALPVIGYSEAMVTAGALAAVFSDARQIGREAAELISAALRDPATALGAPRHPKYFHVACNPSVARYLDLERACAPELPARLGAER